MAISCGFFNSINHDRLYDAKDLSSIFDGAFSDGVFLNVKINGSLDGNQRFAVTPSSGMTIGVGTGKAWFNHTFTLNDEILFLTLDDSEGILNRYDAIVLEVNDNDDVRDNTIRVIKGIPDSSPSKPTLINGGGIYQYALAYVYVRAAASSILASDIENVVGSNETPYASGLIPMDATYPFGFGIDSNGRYGYKKINENGVTAFTPFDLAIDNDGNYGYIKRGAATVTPFKTGGGASTVTIKKLATVSSNTSIDVGHQEGYEDIWENLTSDNFFYRINSIRSQKTQSQDTSGSSGVRTQDPSTYTAGVHYAYWNCTTGPCDITMTPKLNYNAETGILSVTGMSASGQSWFRTIVEQYYRYIVSLTKQIGHDVTKYDYTTLSMSADIYICY